jgi:DNA polymerase-3 subunit beta
MKIDRLALSSAVDIAALAVDENSIPYVIRNLFIDAHDGNNALRIKGTDLDVEICADIEAVGVPLGLSFNANAKQFKTLLAKAPKAMDVEAECVSDISTRLGFGRTSYTMESAIIEPPKDGETDALESKASTGHLFTMPGGVLKMALERIRHGISTEETRYYLNGVYWDASGDRLALVATDGHRLFRQIVDKPDDMGEIRDTVQAEGKEAATVPGVIIPKRAVEILLKLFGKRAPAEVDIRMDASVMEFGFPFEFGNIRVRTKLIDGTFPDYRRIIPNDHDKAITVWKPDIIAAINAVSFIIDKGKAGIKFQFGGDDMMLFAKGENGTASTPVEGDKNFSEEFELEMNFRYLLQAIAILDGDIRMETQLPKVLKEGEVDWGCPVMMTSSSVPDFLAMQMPMGRRG